MRFANSVSGAPRVATDEEEGADVSVDASKEKEVGGAVKVSEL